MSGLPKREVAAARLTFPVGVSGEIETKFVYVRTSDGPDLIERSVAPIMSGFRNLAGFCLPPFRYCQETASLAEAIECVFFEEIGAGSNEVRSIAVRAECDQITRMALRTFDAMTNAERHATLSSALLVPSERISAPNFEENDEREEIRCESTG